MSRPYSITGQPDPLTGQALATGQGGVLPAPVRSVSASGGRGQVPWWGLASSLCAPVLLVLGWTSAAALQPRTESYDWIRQTVSVLAAPGATDPWVMTLTFLLVGACDVVTGLALRPAAKAGRIVLVAGAIGGMLVTVNPESAAGGSSARHAFFAGIGFVALTLWPVLAAHWRGSRAAEPVPWALRPAVGVRAAIVTAVLFAWFGVELLAGLRHLGLAERALGEFQAVWPLVVVLSCHWRPAGRRAVPTPAGAPVSPARATLGLVPAEQVPQPTLSQLNLAVSDLSASLEFYRRLGFPAEVTTDGQHAALTLPDGFVVELDTTDFVPAWNSGYDGRTGGSTVIGFSLPTRQAVDDLYASLADAGYQGSQPPWDAFWGARYAIVRDPDGNGIGLMSPVDDDQKCWPPTPPPRV